MLESGLVVVLKGYRAVGWVDAAIANIYALLSPGGWMKHILVTASSFFIEKFKPKCDQGGECQ